MSESVLDPQILEEVSDDSNWDELPGSLSAMGVDPNDDSKGESLGSDDTEESDNEDVSSDETFQEEKASGTSSKKVDAVGRPDKSVGHGAGKQKKIVSASKKIKSSKPDRPATVPVRVLKYSAEHPSGSNGRRITAAKVSVPPGFEPQTYKSLEQFRADPPTTATDYYAVTNVKTGSDRNEVFRGVAIMNPNKKGEHATVYIMVDYKDESAAIERLDIADSKLVAVAAAANLQRTGASGNEVYAKLGKDLAAKLHVADGNAALNTPIMSPALTDRLLRQKPDKKRKSNKGKGKGTAILTVKTEPKAGAALPSDVPSKPKEPSSVPVQKRPMLKCTDNETVQPTKKRRLVDIVSEAVGVDMAGVTIQFPL